MEVLSAAIEFQFTHSRTVLQFVNLKRDMKVTQEKLPSSQIGLNIEIDAEVSKKTYEKVVQNLARTANIPGFRKGKVPRQILIQRLGSERVKAAALEEILQNAVDAAIKQEKIDALGNYQVEPSFEQLINSFQPEQSVSFKVAVDVPPTVALSEYRNLTIKAEEVLYDEAQLEQYLSQKQSELATLVPVENRPAQQDDTVIVDYETFEATESGEKGEPIADLKADEYKVELVQDRLLPGMLEGLVGMNPGEVKDVLVSFPADYPRTELASKDVIFTFSLKEIKAKELPNLDDDFASEISEHETFEELKKSLQEDFQKRAQDSTTENIHLAILDELVKSTEIELPETLIEQETQAVLTQTAMQMEQYGLDVNKLFTKENLPKLKANARPDAIKKLKEKLILEEIGKTEKLTVDPADLQEKIEQVKQELADRQVDDNRLRSYLEGELLSQKTLEWLQQKAQIELLPPGSTTAKPEEEAAVDTIDVKAEQTS